MSQFTTTPSGIPFDPQRPYSLTEEQHYAIYQARHLALLLHDLSSCRDEFAEVRRESVAVVYDLLGDLLDAAIPNLIFKSKGA